MYFVIMNAITYSYLLNSKVLFMKNAHIGAGLCLFFYGTLHMLLLNFFLYFPFFNVYIGNQKDEVCLQLHGQMLRQPKQWRSAILFSIMMKQLTKSSYALHCRKYGTFRLLITQPFKRLFSVSNFSSLRYSQKSSIHKDL